MNSRIRMTVLLDIIGAIFALAIIVPIAITATQVHPDFNKFMIGVFAAFAAVFAAGYCAGRESQRVKP